MLFGEESGRQTDQQVLCHRSGGHGGACLVQKRHQGASEARCQAGAGGQARHRGMAAMVPSSDRPPWRWSPRRCSEQIRAFFLVATMKIRMSFPSTLGFAPIIEERPSVWKTSNGRQEFLSMVQEHVNSKLANETPLPRLEMTHELQRILDRSIGLDDTSTLDRPSAEIENAAIYASAMYASRVRMHRRLYKMRQGNCSAALQPRGSAEADRFDESFGRSVRGSGNLYNQFRASQQELRTRFS